MEILYETQAVQLSKFSYENKEKISKFKLYLAVE